MIDGVGSDDDVDDRLTKEQCEVVVEKTPIVSEADRVVHAVDVILRASTAAQSKQMRRAAPLFDWLFRVRTACGGSGALREWLEMLASKRTRDTELLIVGVAVRLLRTTDLTTSEVIDAVVELADMPRLYATCCTVIALIRLEYVAQLGAFLSSEEGLAYTSAVDTADGRGVLFEATKRPFAAAAVLVAIESGAFASVDFLLRDAWFGTRISLFDLTPIGEALDRLVRTIMARAETDRNALPLFTSDETTMHTLAQLPIGANLRALLGRLSSWQRQSIRQRVVDDSAVAVHEDQHRYQLSRLAKLSQTASVLHLSAVQDLCADNDEDDEGSALGGATTAEAVAELRTKMNAALMERTQVCARLEQAAPSDMDQGRVRERRPHVLAALEDAIYNYRVLLAVECSGHEKALAAKQAALINEQNREAEQSIESIRASLQRET